MRIFFVFMLIASVPSVLVRSARLISIPVRQETCTDGLFANEVISKCYEATYQLIRKGLSDEIATGHLQTVVRDMVKYLVNLGKNKTTDSLHGSCIPAECYSELFSVRWTTIHTEAALDDLYVLNRPYWGAHSLWIVSRLLTFKTSAGS